MYSGVPFLAAPCSVVLVGGRGMGEVPAVEPVGFSLILSYRLTGVRTLRFI